MWAYFVHLSSTSSHFVEEEDEQSGGWKGNKWKQSPKCLISLRQDACGCHACGIHSSLDRFCLIWEWNLDGTCARDLNHIRYQTPALFTSFYKGIPSSSWNKTTREDVSVRERCERGRDKRVREKDRERGEEREGIDSDRNCPGLSPGLLSGRVCASLSACLSSPLLSILLKTICLLIIHRLLFWTDMFSLHRYFHCSSNVPFPPTPKNGRAVSLPARHTLRLNNIS